MSSRGAFRSAVTAACLAVSTSLFASELLRNNSFDQGSNYWHASASAATDLFAVPGQVNLHISGYVGNVVHQDLDVADAGGACGTARITLRKNTTTLTASNTIAVYVAYTDDTGQTNRLLLFKPANADMAAGMVTNLSTAFTLPATARRIVRYDVDKIYVAGNYDAFEVSLDVTTTRDLSLWFRSISSVHPAGGGWEAEANQLAVVGSTVHSAWIASANPASGLYATSAICYRRSVDGGRTFLPPLMLDGSTNDAVRTTQLQTWLAVDGVNVHLVALWQTHQMGTGIPQRLLYYRSTNNGESFEPGRVLSTDTFDSGTMEPSWIAADGGNVTIAHLHLNTVPAGTTGLRVLRSTDNGSSFSLVVAYTITNGGSHISDLKQSGNNVDVIWKDSYHPMHVLPTGATRIACSTDGGASFVVTELEPWTAYSNYLDFDMPQVCRSGSNVFATFTTEIAGQNPPVVHLYLCRSADGGVTFHPPTNLTAGVVNPTYGLHTVAARGSKVYVAFSEVTGSGSGRVFLRRSLDGGATWQPLQELTGGGNSTFEPGWEPRLALGAGPAGQDQVHLLWGSDSYRVSQDSGNSFSPPVHLKTYHSAFNPTAGTTLRQPRTALDAEGVFHFNTVGYYSWGSNYIIGYRRQAPMPAGLSQNQGLQLAVVPSDHRYDTLQVPGGPSLALARRLSVELWVRFDANTNFGRYPAILGKEVAAAFGGQTYTLLTYDSGGQPGEEDRVFQLSLWPTNSAGGVHAIGVTTLADGTWHHVAFTYDADAGADNVRLYVDGHLDAVATATGPLPTGDGPCWIGTVPGYQSTPFSGTVDDLRFWNRALTAQEIADRYAGPLVGTEQGLAAYYPLNSTTREATGQNGDGVLMYKESFGAGADVQPTLRVEADQASRITLSWVTFGASHTVKTTADLASPDWQTAPGTPQFINGRWVLTVDVGNGSRFFRLQR